MSLNKQQIDALLGLISSAESDSADCDSCFEHLAEFAETELSGKDIPEALQTVQRHLQQCPCCREEYEALLEGLRAVNDEDM